MSHVNPATDYHEEYAHMTDNQKRELINNLNLVADRIDSDWKRLTVAQVEGLKEGINILWDNVCRRVSK